MFTEPLNRGKALKLGDLVNGIDMIDPFGTIPVSLMDRVDADIAGSPLGPRFASLTNAVVYRASLILGTPLARVG